MDLRIARASMTGMDDNARSAVKRLPRGTRVAPIVLGYSVERANKDRWTEIAERVGMSPSALFDTMVECIQLDGDGRPLWLPRAGRPVNADRGRGDRRSIPPPYDQGVAAGSVAGDPAPADRFANRIYYEDQSAWRPADYYALFRYLNRLFLNQRGIKTAEIAALDLVRMSDETRYLMKHMLVLKKAYDRFLEDFTNLRALEDVGELGHPLWLDEEPIGIYDYFTRQGIYL